MEVDKVTVLEVGVDAILGGCVSWEGFFIKNYMTSDIYFTTCEIETLVTMTVGTVTYENTCF